MVSIIDLSDEPKYSIKSVCSQTGIRSVTLRAWERRHEVLTPHRSENRYRLYSERDVAILRWIKGRVDSGVSISNAVQELRTLQENDLWPEAILPPPSILPVHHTTPPEQYADRLYQALIRHREDQAAEILQEALSIFDLQTLCIEVLTPCLVEIGEAWFRGEIRITTEHFASAFIRGKLLSLLQTYPARRNAPHLIIGCAPDEAHEIGSLMLAVLLRGKGYRVEYLGADIPVDDLVDYAGYENPDMIILSATMESSTAGLRQVQARLEKTRSRPVFGYGGRVFNLKPAVRMGVPGVYLGETLDKALQNIPDELRRANKRVRGFRPSA